MPVTAVNRAECTDLAPKITSALIHSGPGAESLIVASASSRSSSNSASAMPIDGGGPARSWAARLMPARLQLGGVRHAPERHGENHLRERVDRRDYMPGIGKNSRTSMLPPWVLCG